MLGGWRSCCFGRVLAGMKLWKSVFSPQLFGEGQDVKIETLLPEAKVRNALCTFQMRSSSKPFQTIENLSPWVARNPTRNTKNRQPPTQPRGGCQIYEVDMRSSEHQALARRMVAESVFRPCFHGGRSRS